MRGTWALAALAMAGGLAGCDDDGAPRAHFAGGGRLRAQWWELPGGVTLFRQFFDTARGEPCQFDGLLGPSGLDRCLPLAHVELFRASVTDFADPACTEPAIAVVGTTLPSVVVELPDDACAGEPAVFGLGPELTSHYRRDPGGACVPATTRSFYRVGSPLPLDRFVGAAAVVEPTGDRIAGYTLTTGDGARQVIGGWDRDRDERVAESPELAADRWTPRGIAYAFGATFADPACTRPVAQKLGDSAVCPITTVLGAGGAHVAGPAVDPRSLFGHDGAGACVATPIDRDDLRFVEVGAPIAIDALAPLPTVDHGTDRVHRRDAASPDGTPILPRSTSPLFDTATGQPCDIRVATDGVPRCLPQRFDGGYFADAACTRPLVQASQPPALVSIDTGAPARFAVHPVGAPFTDATIHVAGAAGCAAVTRGDGVEYFALGDARAPTDFVAALAHD